MAIIKNTHLFIALFVCLVFTGCENKEKSVKHFNDFDTFTLKPLNTKAKKCPLKLECHYIGDKLSCIYYRTNADSLIVKDTVLYIKGKQYFIHDDKMRYEDDTLKNKLKVIRYLENGVIREAVMSNINNIYSFTRINELRKNNSYHFLSWKYVGNFNENKKYNSIVDFISNDIDKIKAVHCFYKRQLNEYSYTDDCKIRDLFVMYAGKSRIESAGYREYDTFGECLYLDCLRDN